ncbi:MAG: hypothetical protein J7M25_01750 [Deltaproteobacteria bacterium]|nr:hypothetical protein [Deltaproteobacteria bacterium]
MPRGHEHINPFLRHAAIALAVTLLCTAGLTVFLARSVEIRPGLADILAGPDRYLQQWNAVQAGLGPEQTAVVRLDRIDPANEPDQILVGRAVHLLKSIPGTDVAKTHCAKKICLILHVDPSKTDPKQVFAQLASLRTISPKLTTTVCGELEIRHLMAGMPPTILTAILWAGLVLLVMLLVTGGGIRSLVLTIAVLWTATVVMAVLWHILFGPLTTIAVYPAIALLATAILFSKRMADTADWSESNDSKKTAKTALDRQKGPLLLISGVIAIALATMGASRFPALRRSALTAAAAIILSAAAALTVGVAILALWPPRHRRRAAQASRLSLWVGKLQQRSTNWPRAGLMIGSIILVVVIVLATRLPLNQGLPTKDGKRGACVVKLDLVISADNQLQLTSHDFALWMARLTKRITRIPGIEGAFWPGLQNHDETVAPHYISRQDPIVRVALLARADDTATIESLATRVKRAITPLQSMPSRQGPRPDSATGQRIAADDTNNTDASPRDFDPQRLSFHMTGPLVAAAHAVTRLTHAHLVALTRFLGMLFMVIIALTWDPRLGLTVVSPALVTTLLLVSVMAVTKINLDLPAQGAIGLVALWAGMDTLSNLLEAARSRRRGAPLSRHASSSSLRAAWAIGLSLLVAGVCCRTSPFLKAAILVGIGIPLAAALSAYGVPTMLAYMPGARLQGPLWEPRRRRRRSR